MNCQGQDFQLGIEELFLSPVFPGLPAPRDFAAPFGGPIECKAKRRETFPAGLVNWKGCNVKQHTPGEVSPDVRPHDVNMKLTPFLQRPFSLQLDMIEHDWKIRHRHAVTEYKESVLAQRVCGLTLWFLLHNVALAASEVSNVTFRFFKEIRSSSVPSSTLSQEVSSPKQPRLLPELCSSPTAACEVPCESAQVQEQQPQNVRKSSRVRRPTEKASASEQGTESRLVEVGDVLSGASRYTCRVDSVICELEHRYEHAIAKVIFEFKGSDTLGLVDEGLYSNSDDLKSLTWDKVVEDALQAFGTNADRDDVYGSLIQLLNSMLVLGAEVGVLHDLQTYVFVELRRRASESGDESRHMVDPSVQLKAEDFTVSFLVKRYSDREPTMQQVLVHFLRKYAGRSAAWVDAFCPPDSHRRQLLVSALKRLDLTAAESDPVESAAPSETEVGRVRGSGTGDSSHLPTDDVAEKGLSAKKFDFKVDELGFQVALTNGSPIWHYGTKGEHVLKLAHCKDKNKAECLERELRAYLKASNLQGKQLLRLHDYGWHPQGPVYVLVLDYVCMQLGLPSWRFYERAVAAAIWQAYQALWAEGVAHCDIHEGNIRVRERKDEGDGAFKVTILDFGLADVYSGGLPADVRKEEEAGVSRLCGRP